MALDLTTLAARETATMHLKDPAGELLYADTAKKKPARIVVWGPGSEAAETVESQEVDRMVEKLLIEKSGGEVPADTYEERVRKRAEKLAAMTVEFENISYPKAGDAEGKALFAAVYSDRSIGFIAGQVERFLNDWGNFKPGSATS